METRNKKNRTALTDEQFDKAVIGMVYGIFALVLLLAVACVGGVAWVLYIITKVVTQ